MPEKNPTISQEKNSQFQNDTDHFDTRVILTQGVWLSENQKSF
jgi:hypothetical protein